MPRKVNKKVSPKGKSKSRFLREEIRAAEEVRAAKGKSPSPRRGRSSVRRSGSGRKTSPSPRRGRSSVRRSGSGRKTSPSPRRGRSSVRRSGSGRKTSPSPRRGRSSVHRSVNIIGDASNEVVLTNILKNFKTCQDIMTFQQTSPENRDFVMSNISSIYRNLRRNDPLLPDLSSLWTDDKNSNYRLFVNTCLENEIERKYSELTRRTSGLRYPQYENYDMLREYGLSHDTSRIAVRRLSGPQIRTFVNLIEDGYKEHVALTAASLPEDQRDLMKEFMKKGFSDDLALIAVKLPQDQLRRVLRLMDKGFTEDAYRIVLRAQTVDQDFENFIIGKYG